MECSLGDPAGGYRIEPLVGLPLRLIKGERAACLEARGA